MTAIISLLITFYYNFIIAKKKKEIKEIFLKLQFSIFKNY